MLARARASLGASLGTLAAQLFFIAAGVYIGNRADEWRQAVEHRRAARDALENFRTELAANRDRLAGTARIYGAYADSMEASQRRGDPEPRSIREVFRRVDWHGLSPMRFEHTAWDLALATQALSYVPRPLAFRVARLYTAQRAMEDLQRDIGNGLFSNISLDDARVRPFLFTFGAYVEDSVIQSRTLAAGYARLLPALDSAIARLPR